MFLRRHSISKNGNSSDQRQNEPVSTSQTIRPVRPIPAILVVATGLLLEDDLHLVSQDGEVEEGNGGLHVPLGVRDVPVAPLLAGVHRLAMVEVGAEVLVPCESLGDVVVEGQDGGAELVEPGGEDNWGCREDFLLNNDICLRLGSEHKVKTEAFVPLLYKGK